MTAHFTSERLDFRLFGLDDISEDYVGWLNDPEVNRYLETRHVVQTVETCRSYVTSVSKDPNSHFFAVRERASGRHIGNTKLGFINRVHKNGQLSFFIGDKATWGLGYATEIVGRMTAFAFADAGLEKVEAGCYEQNLRALNAFLKNGYTVEGFMRNRVLVEGQRSATFWVGILPHELKYGK